MEEILAQNTYSKWSYLWVYICVFQIFKLLKKSWTIYITIVKLFPLSHIHFFQRDSEPLTDEIWNPNSLFNIFLDFSQDFKFVDYWICIISKHLKKNSKIYFFEPHISFYHYHIHYVYQRKKSPWWREVLFHYLWICMLLSCYHTLDVFQS